MSVKVAVRVRPFNEREIKGNSKCCVKMQGPTTIIFDPETGKDKPFSFDYSFWSHDGFDDVDGISVPQPGSVYADQQMVYEALGKQVLDNAWEGYHCCLFAYGQTGSGKSYSMVGYGKNRGIVPISCDEIFKRIRSYENEDTKFQVQFSMLEIYNEKVQDLLIADPAKKPAGGLKVRESPSGDVYVQGLSKYPVDSYAMIEKKMDEGYDNRSIGSTLMNKTSSRAHTIITIEFKQVTMLEGKKMEKFSVINLVDLAGSEKAGQTGAEGQRLKEGCAINQSLTTLGTCISVLADKAMGKQKKTVVPYRDSNLTRILQNALGGNSKTIMICAISPADMNYEESMSTLRYADRAKKIQNKAVINESAQDKLIRELKAENQKLRSLLLSAAQGNGTINIADLGMGSAQDIIEQMDHAEQQIDDTENFEFKLQQSKKIDQEREHQIEEKKKKENKRAPHLTNLNEDPQLSQHLYFGMNYFPVTVGRKTDDPKPDIIFGGVSIHKNHARFNLLDNGLIQFEILQKEALQTTYVEGQKLMEDGKIILNHLDTIYFGQGQMLLFKYPLQNQCFINIKKEIMLENLENELSEQEIKDLTIQRLLEQGVTQDTSNLVCENYEDQQIQDDFESVDWDKAQQKVEQIEEQERKLALIVLQEAEREKAKQEFEKRQEEEQKKHEELLRQSEELKKQIEEKQRKMEEEKEENQRKEQEMLQRLEIEQQQKSLLLQQNTNEQEQLRIKMIEEMKDKYEKEIEAQRLQDKIKLELQQAELDLAKKKYQNEIEKRDKAMNEYKKQQENNKKNEQKQIQFQQKLKDLRKDINEANTIAKFMNKEIKFKEIYVSKFDDQNIHSLTNNTIQQMEQTQDEVQIKVENFESGLLLIWSVDKFQDKLLQMRDALQVYEEKDFQQFDESNDPFYEKQEPILLGQSFYMLEGLAYLIDNPRKLPIVATNSSIVGEIFINIVPCEEDGNEDMNEDLLPEEPKDLLNQSISFKVKIDKIENLPEDFCRNIFCEYKFYMDEQKYTTDVFQGKSQTPQFNYEKIHHVECVTKFLIDYLLEDKLTIKIYGNQDLKKKEGKTQKQLNDTLNSTKSSITNNSNISSKSSNQSQGKNEQIIKKTIQPTKAQYNPLGKN